MIISRPADLGALSTDATTMSVTHGNQPAFCPLQRQRCCDACRHCSFEEQAASSAGLQKLLVATSW